MHWAATTAAPRSRETDTIGAGILLGVAHGIYGLCFENLPEMATHRLTHQPGRESLRVCGPCAHDPRVHEALEAIATATPRHYNPTG